MTPLKTRILEQIKTAGPISIANYMSQCLLDPTHGYYPTRDPLGIDGDFITAPEISQMFGEVLGLWLINSWRDMGRPERIYLIELGPGRGVMMSDMLRTARLEPDFYKALHIYLIEPSSALEGKQAQILGHIDIPVQWVSGLKEVPSGPSIVIGNEYLDCLPVRQFVVKDPFAGHSGLYERLISVKSDNPQKLVYDVSPSPISAAEIALLPKTLPELKTDQIVEVNTGLAYVIDEIKTRFDTHPGAALFIDYGPDTTETGDTFQALKNHEKVYPLDAPGEADLTARVNFAHVLELAIDAGLSVFGPTPQNTFLSKLGIEVRAVALSKSAPAAKAKIARQLHRLTHSDEMGTLFKAICLQADGLAPPLGFNP